MSITSEQIEKLCSAVKLNISTFSLDEFSSILENLRNCERVIYHQTYIAAYLSKCTLGMEPERWAEWYADTMKMSSVRNAKRHASAGRFLHFVINFDSMGTGFVSDTVSQLKDYNDYYSHLHILVIESLASFIPSRDAELMATVPDGIAEFQRRVPNPDTSTKAEMLQVLFEIKNPEIAAKSSEELEAERNAREVETFNKHIADLFEFRGNDVRVDREVQLFEAYTCRLLTSIQETPANWNEPALLQFYADIKDLVQEVEDSFTPELRAKAKPQTQSTVPFTPAKLTKVEVG